MTIQSVKYRPGRYQVLTAEQEIVLKQTWAYILKYLGYEINIDDEDLKYKECFIASTTTEIRDVSQLAPLPLTSVMTKVSQNSKVSTKKRGGLFRGKKQVEVTSVDSPSPDSRRMRQIQTQSSQERYYPVATPSQQFYDLYGHHYKCSYEYADDYVEDSDYYNDNDTASQYSVDSFVTASTSFDDINFRPALSSGSLRTKVPSTNDYRSTAGKHKSIHHNPNLLSFFADYNPHDIQRAMVQAARNDLLDNLILRFVRARKWDTEKALQMLFRSLDWRVNDMPADKWVYEADGPSYLQGINQGFIKNLTTEKAWIKGRDKFNNPIYVFQAKKHFASDSTVEQGKRFVILTIETIRLFLRDINESCDTVTVVFDLTGFTLKNADYASIKFLAECLEAHYPETLGFILVHNAPWIFSTVWNIIKGWIDPFVAAKINFTKNAAELGKFIDPKFIPDYLGGKDTKRAVYPIPDETDDRPPKPKDATYNQLRHKRDELFLRFLETTKRWVESTSPMVSDMYYKDKLDLCTQLSYNYLEMDPYVRNRGIYDRDGTLKVSN